ncbi:MAG: hypothetical protein E7317_09635 [Clostridiales bacterium]|nr:hypothetical protein [Clostridiales bacterium]
MPTEAPADEPTEVPMDAPTEAPGQEPADTPSAAPDETPSATETPAPSTTPAPGYEAWTEADGEKVTGTLEEMVALAAPQAKIYIATEKTVKVRDAKLRDVAKLTFLPDPRVFTQGDEQVFVYAEDPDKVDMPTEIDLKECAESEGEMDLFFRVESVGEDEETTPAPDGTPEPAETPEPTEEPAIEIAVTARDYDPARWTSVAPTFELRGLPDIEGYSYIYTRDEERIYTLEGDTFSPDEDGVYTLCFAIQDEWGDIVSISRYYTVKLDYTEPAVSVEVNEDTGLDMMIEAQDNQSGVRALSLDGGSSWISLGDEPTATFGRTYASATTLYAGQIMVLDAAGNVFISEEDVVLKPVASEGGGGGGSGSGEGDGTTKKAVSHGKGTGTDEGLYDQVEVETATGAEHQLTLGGETLQLTLDLAEAEGFDIPQGYQAKFLTDLRSWPVEGMAVRTDDTVVLTAVPEPELTGDHEYQWHFNGEVLKLLGNSGISYLVLRIGDDVIALPTGGFTGGTKYTELKMSGVSTRKFDYTVSMSYAHQGCAFALSVNVDGEEYALPLSATGEMYAYDVYTGTADLLERPYDTLGNDRETEEEQ